MNNISSQGLETMFGLASKGVEMGMQSAFDTAQAKRNAQIQEKLMESNNKMLRENFRDSAGLAKAGQIGAGLNPAGQFQATNISPSVPSAGASVASPQQSAYQFARQMQMAQELNDSEVDKNNADAELARATAKKTGYESSFLGQTLNSRINLTNKENANKYYIEGYMEEHPDLLEAVASSQRLLNEKVASETDVNKKQLSVLESIIKKNNSDISLNDAKKAFTYANTKFVKGQTEYFKNKDFRENYQNVGWLLNEMKNVASSNDANKDSKLALLKECLGYVSGETLQSNDIQAKKDMQFIDLNVKQDIANKDRKVAQQRADASSKIADAQDLKVKADIVFKTIDVLIKVFDRVFSALSSDELDDLDNMFENSDIMDGINATEIFY